MALISVQNICLRFGGPPLLDSVSFDIEEGECVCLVGRNGEGKSTLLKILSGEMQADSGEIIRKNGLHVARLIQEIPAHIKGTVREIVLGENKERNSFGESILGKTGIDSEAFYDDLSGGQKRRVLFAKALASEPDLLLLDEPTNHLDIASIQWLEGILSRLSCAVLFISHDRAFVKKLSKRILELDRGKIKSWNFPYDKFVEYRDAALAEEETSNKLFDKRLAEEEIWIRKGIQARRTRNEGRVRALLKMREERANRRNRTGSVNMQITEAERSGKLVVRAENVSFCYEGSEIIKDFSVEISRGDRVGIVGENGCGKTTLLKILLGELSPDKGSVRLGTNLQIAYFDQMRTRLREDKSLIENIGDGQEYVVLNGEKRHVLSYLQDFLFTAERARGPISALSGGEKNRLLLACLFSHPSNVLVLDEPTNDLDMETLDLLANLLAEYKGTVITVSHDRAFLDSFATTILGFEGLGNIHENVGGYTEYAEIRKIREKQEGKSDSFVKEKELEQKKEKVKTKRSYKEEREYEALPEKIENLEQEIALLEQELTKEEIYTDHVKLTKIQREIAEKEKELTEFYERFEELDSIG
ncbi:MAG: ATP-binding cassette domain-containing protein [Fibrobacteraceae bacterium]|jgi:ATP-binding cassette subfamily F protein uup|nr:ATP-binding cassette domain-containing protein [Fibrobacteraceae bacterium]